jgi:hypothetical protein
MSDSILAFCGTCATIFTFLSSNQSVHYYMIHMSCIRFWQDEDNQQAQHIARSYLLHMGCTVLTSKAPSAKRIDQLGQREKRSPPLGIEDTCLIEKVFIFAEVRLLAYRQSSLRKPGPTCVC